MVMDSSGMDRKYRVAVTQHEPCWLDIAKTSDKTCAIIQEAAAAGAKLVVFPECWIPGYPAWIWSRPVDFELGVKYVENCLTLDSPYMRRIQDAAAEHGINVGLGFSERDGDSVYIAQAIINDKGELKMARRKMKPTHMERTIFGDASGSCLAPVVALDQEGPKVGSLSCWSVFVLCTHSPTGEMLMLAQGAYPASSQSIHIHPTRADTHRSVAATRSVRGRLAGPLVYDSGRQVCRLMQL